MSERIIRPVALFLVSVVLVALAAGAALAQDKASEIRANSKSVTTKASLIGTNGNDWLDDFYFGYNSVYGLLGNDVLAGHNGSDYLQGNGGYDQIFGENDGDWWLDGWTEDDVINPGPGNDTALGYSGNDAIDGNHKNSFLGQGWQKDDAGNDKLYGESGNDYMIDWVGYDYVYGGYDNDTINVKDGYCYDYVDGGPGYDTVYADSCDSVYNAESVKSAADAKSDAHKQRPEAPKVSAKATAHPKSVR